jgi:uncharacterized iron-regulated protein
MPRTAAPVALTLALALAAGACASSQKPQAANPHGDPHHGRAMDLDAAALPFHVLGADGREVAEADFVTALAGTQAVCLGESHKNPHHHWAQLHLLRALSERATKEGRALALGMEMFQTPFQGVLDDFAEGRIDEPTMLSRTGWAVRWGHDFDLYRPIIVLAVERKHPVLALNAPDEITDKVAEEGLDSLSPDEKASLPPLDLTNERHRAFFKEATEGHGEGLEDRFELFYTAQVIWDETMAETSARWLAGGEGRQIVILAGTGHCQATGIPLRLERRGVKSISVHPVLDDGEGAVAAALADRSADYLLVLTIPR